MTVSCVSCTGVSHQQCKDRVTHPLLYTMHEFSYLGVILPALG